VPVLTPMHFRRMGYICFSGPQVHEAGKPEYSKMLKACAFLDAAFDADDVPAQLVESVTTDKKYTFTLV
jgi:hypothetical protein